MGKVLLVSKLKFFKYFKVFVYILVKFVENNFKIIGIIVVMVIGIGLDKFYGKLLK